MSMPSTCSCRKPVPSTSWIAATSIFPAFMCCTKTGAFFVTRAKSNMDFHRVYSAPTDRVDRHHLRPDHLPGRQLRHPPGATPNICAASASRTLRPARRWCSSPTSLPCPAAAICASVQKPLAGGALLQVDQAASSHQTVLRHLGERGEDADLDRRLGLRSRRHHQEASRPGRLALHFATDPLGHAFRENAHTSSACWRRKQMQRFANNQPIEFIHVLTGH